MLRFRTRPENGIIEWWKAGPPQADQKDVSTLILVSPVGAGPLIQHCIIPEPIIPLFQYSIIPIVSEAN
jgi:hypothetical protein